MSAIANVVPHEHGLSAGRSGKVGLGGRAMGWAQGSRASHNADQWCAGRSMGVVEREEIAAAAAANSNAGRCRCRSLLTRSVVHFVLPILLPLTASTCTSLLTDRTHCSFLYSFSGCFYLVHYCWSHSTPHDGERGSCDVSQSQSSWLCARQKDSPHPLPSGR